MIRIADITDKSRIKELWKLCFTDTDKFIAFYFAKVFRPEDTLILEEDGLIKAALQIIPYTIKTGDQILHAGYISGAMTHPAYRRQGYMVALLQAAFNKMTEREMDISFLIPQEQWLFDFYRRYGYTNAFPRFQKKITVDARLADNVSDASLINQEIDYEMYKSLLQRNDPVVLKTEQQISLLIEDHKISGGKIFAHSGGIAFVLLHENNVWIKELLYADNNCRDTLLTAISAYYQPREMYLIQYHRVKASSYYGMVKPLKDSVNIPANIYMTMMLD